MAGRNSADIVFCLDASGSMSPCFQAVRENIGKLLEGLQTDAQTTWDVRFDFLAFHDMSSLIDGDIHYYRTVNLGAECIDQIYGGEASAQSGDFFTKDLSRFREALAQVEIEGEEMQLLALDVAMDFPWRPSSSCHRVIVLLSDESVETGIQVKEQEKRVADLMNKLQEKRIKLFIIAPESPLFFKISEADRCEYTDLQGSRDGLSSVDFSKLLATIGRSVSISQSYDGGKTEPKPLFGQNTWTHVSDVKWSKD